MKNPNTGLRRNETMVVEKNISYTLTLALMLLGTVCLAQDLPGEKLSMHANRSYFLAGDEILFALYCIETGSGLPSHISVLANVELINQQGEVIKREKILLKNGFGSGSIQIPGNINSGEHLIRSYTSWMRNFGPGTFLYKPILVIHPSKKYKSIHLDTAIRDSIQPHGKQAPNPEAGIQIKGLKINYTPRDTIAFTLSPADNSGIPQSATLSISITRSESLYPTPFPSIITVEKKVNPPEWNARKFSPDMKGLQLSGTITRPGSGEPVGNRLVLLSFIDSITGIYNVISDSGGRFVFDLNGMRGRKDMVIQVPGKDQDILISIHPDLSLEQIPEEAWFSMNKDGLEEQYGEMLMEKQLSAAYGLFSDPPVANPGISPGKKPLPFYGKPDHKILMEDYVKLPVMEEVFRELGKRIFLQRDEGKYRVLILDLETNRLIGNHPYYFMDGIPFFDSEKLLAIDPSLIKSISLKSRKYFMGDLIMDGIIDIQSKKGDAALVDFPRSAIREYFQGFQYPNPTPGHITSGMKENYKEPNSRIPIYTTTLLFESHVETGPDRSAIFNLPAPDSKGSYTITIRGFTHRGIPVQKDVSFRVQ